jgi:hypothetical protein
MVIGASTFNLAVFSHDKEKNTLHSAHSPQTSLLGSWRFRILPLEFSITKFILILWNPARCQIMLYQGLLEAFWVNNGVPANS